MKRKMMIGLIAGLLLISLTTAGILSGSLTPRDTELVSELPTEVQNRLDDDFRNSKWDNDVTFVDDNKKAYGLLLYEHWNGTDWNDRSINRVLWTNYDVEAKYCKTQNKDFDWKCDEYAWITEEDFLDIKMRQARDKYFLKTYKRLPDVIDREVIDVGEKTFNTGVLPK